MRSLAWIALLAASAAAQNQPDCNNSITRDVDVRCACYKDPASQQCDAVKRGWYSNNTPDWSKVKPMNLWNGTNGMQPGSRPTVAPTPQPVRPQQPRVVPLAHKDYLRFLNPNAQLAAGFDFEKIAQSPEVMEAVFGQTDSDDARTKLLAALKEMDHLWLSFAAPGDLVLLMTGKFEQGAVAGMFYAQGVRPVFLGGSHAMMVGAEPSIQSALARLNKPSANDGWVARRGKELSRDHDTWIVNEHLAAGGEGLRAIRRFAIGFRISGDTGVDGDAVTDSEVNAQKLAAWIEQMKTAIRQKTGVGALDSLAVKTDGATLHFAAKGDTLLAGESGKTALNSDFGVELYGVMMAGFPGVPARTVASDRMLAVKTGMKREELLALLGEPLSVSAIQGLDIPKETWTYQVAFGQQATVRLDGGVVTSASR